LATFDLLSDGRGDLGGELEALDLPVVEAAHHHDRAFSCVQRGAGRGAAEIEAGVDPYRFGVAGTAQGLLEMVLQEGPDGEGLPSGPSEVDVVCPAVFGDRCRLGRIASPFDGV
jgi:hypothetical protein